MGRVHPFNMMLAALLLANASCGTSKSPTASTSQVVVDNKSGPDTSAGPGPSGSENPSPLSLQILSLNEQVSFGFWGTGLKGRCVSGALVVLEGDVPPGQTTECVDGQFEFQQFRLAENDGLKRIAVSQIGADGNRLVTPLVIVRQNTAQAFRIPEDAVSFAPRRGLRGSITNVFASGDHLVLSHRSGGLSISRDGGQSWSTKSYAQGLMGRFPQIFAAQSNVFYATSTEGLFLSRDFGKSWTKSPALSSQVHKIHIHEGRVFADAGKSGISFSADNGETWTSTSGLPVDTSPFFEFIRTMTSVGKRLYTTTNIGLHIYNPDSNTWQPFRIPDLKGSQRIDTIETNEKLILVRASESLSDFNADGYTYFVSADGGLTWKAAHSTLNLSEPIALAAENLVRWTNGLATFDVRVSRDAGKFWAPLTLPPSMFLQRPVIAENAVLVDGSSVLLRSRDRIAVSTDVQLTAWKSFEIPSGLKNSTLLSYRILNGRRFIVFEQGVLFSDSTATKWDSLLMENDTGPSPRGLVISGRKVLSWSASSFAQRRLGGLFISRDGGSNFENITARLNLLEGFYTNNQYKIYSSGSGSAGYSLPVSDVALSDSRIFVATPEGLAISSDDALSFKMLPATEGKSVPLPNDIEVEGQNVAVATQAGGILLSKNNGDDWVNVSSSSGLPFNNPTRVALFGERVFAVSGTTLALSSDFGKSWQSSNVSSEFPDATVRGIRFLDGKIIVSLRKSVQTSGGLTTYQYSVGVSKDFGQSYVRSIFPDDIGSETQGVQFWKNEFYFALTKGVVAVSDDLSRTRTISVLPYDATGIGLSEGALFISTTGGIFSIGGPAAVSAAESSATSLRSQPIELAECQEKCPSEIASANTTPTPAPPTLYFPTLTISKCTPNYETGRCSYTMSWSGASLDSCLWFQEAGLIPQKSECGSSLGRTRGVVVVDWLKGNTNYTVFLAPEIASRTPGTRLIQKSLQTESGLTEIVIQPCSAFNHDFCTSTIEWKYAPASSCLWSIHPLTGETFLAACATANNPNGNVIQYPWIAYASLNKFFLARQTAGDPNVPQADRYANAEYSQPWPMSFPSHRTMSSLFCPVGACKNIVRGFVDSYSNGVIQGWACKTGANQSVDVQIFATTQSTRTLLGTVAANIASEPALSTLCGTNLLMHRFSFTLSSTIRSDHQGKGLDLLGIDSSFTDGSRNFLLEKSGMFVID